MAERGWQRLAAEVRRFHGPGKFPIVAYSEFMPPPRLGAKPYTGDNHLPLDPADPWGWPVTEYEEALELEPGLAILARELLRVLRHLGRGEAAHGIAKGKLRGNPYWPEAMHNAGAPPHERYVLLMPLALSQTQDDKGRVRWTLFGASERGPGRAFWRGFFAGPRRELPDAWALSFVRRLLAAAYGETTESLADLRRAGFRVFSTPDAAIVPFWDEGPLPSWTSPYRWTKGQSLRGVRYLLTFCPLDRLPGPVRRAYLGGDLHLLPFPGSLLFFGVPTYLRLARELPTAVQIPLLHSLYRHEAPWGIRIPQSGWLHEARPGGPPPHGDYGPLRDTFRRTHRWARVHRHQDELAVVGTEDKLAHVLFSADAADMGLYGKPMARNCQIWTDDFRLLLDGPRATPERLAAAAGRLAEGGLFGYRMLYPAMQIGRHAVYWHRPLVAYFDRSTGEPAVLPDAPLGSMTAYVADRPRLEKPVEFWPRLLARPAHQAAVRLFTINREHHYRQTIWNLRKLLETWEIRGRRPLPAGLARQLLTLPKEESLDDWLRSLPGHAADAAAAEELVRELRRCVEQAAPRGRPARRAGPPRSLTFGQTARRSFEKTYWNTIAELAAGEYVNKDNADCVNDAATRSQMAHHRRDLDALGDHLLAHYRRVAAAAGMAGKMTIGELPFRWRTDFHFSWSGGWKKNQRGAACERDLIVVIPGRNRRQAVVMADHYDTAYMEDVFGYTHGGGGPRLAAAGADDDHSATAALMLAAPIFLRLAREGRLECDVWLVHLTGEEFPADCIGARHLCQSLVERDLEVRLAGGRRRSLSRAAVRGVYVLDMIAHNSDRDRDIFQICPGTGRRSMWLAEQAHAANQIWNVSTAAWNRRPGRPGQGRGKRSSDAALPAVAAHPALHGEIRPADDPHSALYNTDGQIFSDAGVPVVLFMENYDINRQGYHNSHDTMANIDLDYGAALAAIAIETVARAATEPPP